MDTITLEEMLVTMQETIKKQKKQIKKQRKLLAGLVNAHMKLSERVYGNERRAYEILPGLVPIEEMSEDKVEEAKLIRAYLGLADLHQVLPESMVENLSEYNL